MSYVTIKFGVISLVLVHISTMCLCKSVISSGTTPRIWLKGYTEMDSYLPIITNEFHEAIVHENDFVSKNFSEYVIYSTTQSVDFVCIASYPITWKFRYPEQFSKMQSYQISLNAERLSDFTEDLTEPRNKNAYAYSMTITIINEIHTFRSGYFSCQAADNPNLDSEIYVFIEGEVPLENLHQTVTVNVSRTASEVTLPCRSNRPDAVVSLAKEIKLQMTSLLTPFKNKFFPSPPSVDQTNATLQWVPVLLNSSVHFDPKRGFILDRNTLPDVFGLYKCSLEEEEDEMFSFMNVTFGNEYINDFKPKPVQSPMTVKTSRSFLQCCHSTMTPAVTGASWACDNEAQCEMLKPAFMHDYLVGEVFHPFSIHTTDQRENCYLSHLEYQHQSKILMCKGPNNAEMAGQFLTGFVANTKIPNFQKLKIYDITTNGDAVGIEQRIQFQFDSMENYFTVTYPYYRTNRNHYLTEKDGISSKIRRSSKRLAHYYRRRQRQEFFEGENIRVTCIMLQHFYAMGGWLQLNWKNGTRTIFQHLDFNSVQSMNLHRARFPTEEMPYATGGFRILMESYNDKLALGMINEVSLEMESVDCFAPVWNSVKWDKRTLKLKIKPASPPVFENPDMEIMHLKLNQTDKVISCSVALTTEGSFTPVLIRWMKDGKELMEFNNGIGSVNSTFINNVSMSSLQFFTISHDMQGEYHCLAKQMKAAATKIFKIYIVDEENSHKFVAVTITVSILAILVTIVGILSWRHWMLRMTLTGQAPHD